MDLMHHEDRTLAWIGAVVFLVLVASAMVIATNRAPAPDATALDQVLAPPITQPPSER